MPATNKWDNFWLGFVLAILTPVAAFFLFFVFTYFNSKYINSMSFSFSLYWRSMATPGTFLRTATLCCIPNAAVFFWLVQRHYNNASRAVIIASMLLVMAIVIKEML